MFSTKRSIVAAVVTAACTLPAAAEAAGPGVISYVKDDNVFVVKPDGSGLRAVTRDGTNASPYTSTSWLADGTMWVGHGDRFERLSQAGEVLQALPAPALNSFAWQPIAFDVQVSPDGRRLAFSRQGMGCDAGCTTSRASGVVDIATGRLADSVWERVSSPVWLSSTRLAAAGPATDDFMLKDVDGSAPRRWFNDGSLSITELSASRDRGALAFVTENGLVGTARVAGDPASGDGTSASIDYGCAYTAPRPGGGTNPVFGPDGRTLAFAEPEGIAIVPDSVHTDSASCNATVAAARTIAEPGAYEPAWGDVVYDPAPRNPATPTGPAVTPDPGVKGKPNKKKCTKGKKRNKRGKCVKKRRK